MASSVKYTCRFQHLVSINDFESDTLVTGISDVCGKIGKKSSKMSVNIIWASSRYAGNRPPINETRNTTLFCHYLTTCFAIAFQVYSD